MRSSACIIRTAFAVLCLYDVALHAASFPDPAVDNKNPIGDLLKGDQTAVLVEGRPDGGSGGRLFLVR
jgi:hypothetical protein